jgi:hypothetical protein
MARDFGLPPFACWRHCHAREGFEVVFFETSENGLRIEGHTTALEAGEPFIVQYQIELDERWSTRSALVSGRSRAGTHTVSVESDGSGGWLVDGRAAPELDGCPDVDLESSSLTNAFPVNRLRLEPGGKAEAPAAYVRALDLGVERLEQRYERIDNGDARERYDYASPTFDFRCELVYDESGLVLDYPGIAVRVGA